MKKLHALASNPCKPYTMKTNTKNSEKLRTTWSVLKSLAYLFLLIPVIYVIFCSLKLVDISCFCTKQEYNFTTHHRSDIILSPSGLPRTDQDHGPEPPEIKTNLSHVVFGIGASAKLWDHRKNYVKIWWRPNETRGFVWLDKHVKTEADEEKLLPPLKISNDTSKFTYKNPGGHRSAIRISRIVSETFRLGLEDVRWFVMGDDDTVFVPDNLVRVLQKYDHNHYYYIGSTSESHLQNIHFSYKMAYGGGGFAISYGLAKAIEKMQDRCIQRYPGLYGSDDRIQACMAELGVPLTKEQGFHQFDVYGNIFGLLAAHPIAPLVSLHHLDVIEPIFPHMDRFRALQRLRLPMKLDSAGLMQQSICYDKTRSWTVSVSWGYAIQIFRGILTAREVEIPARTFYNWYPKADYKGFAFNTRPLGRSPCQYPFVYYISHATTTSCDDAQNNQTISVYSLHQSPHRRCNWKMEDPSRIDKVEVYKKPNPHLWEKSPRRNCCRILPTQDNSTMVIEVGECSEDEMIAFR
ncbi:uncharacterized protein LOC122305968 [Carya illinoinensis]|nr:uncharacterized protein LOC122305968 [Carya illinoinensis]